MPQTSLASPPLRKALPAVVLLVVALLGGSGALEWSTSAGPLGRIQTRAAAYLDSSQRLAIEAFAAGRAINAAASILKSTELTPFVVKLAPLEVLEPVDELARQFSDIMALSLAAILLQRLILAVSMSWALAFVLPAGCLLGLLALATARWPGVGQRCARLGRALVMLALFARCVVPLAGWAGAGLTEQFLAADLTRAVATMDAARGSMEKFTAPASTAGPPVVPPATPPSLWNWLRPPAGGTDGMFDRLRSWVPDGTSIAAIGQAMQDVPEQIVRAIEIFLVQTIITPLVVGLLLYAALRSLTRPVQ